MSGLVFRKFHRKLRNKILAQIYHLSSTKKLQTASGKDDTNGARMGEHYRRKGSVYEYNSFNGLNQLQNSHIFNLLTFGVGFFTPLKGHIVFNNDKFN